MKARVLFCTALVLGCVLVILQRIQIPQSNSPGSISLAADWHSMEILRSPDYKGIEQFASTGKLPSLSAGCSQGSDLDAIRNFAENGVLPCSLAAQQTQVEQTPHLTTAQPTVIYSNPVARQQPAAFPSYISRILPRSVTLYGDLNYDPLFLSLDKLRRKQLTDQDTIHNLTSQYVEVL